MPTHHILQIETATQVCSVAISANGETVAFRDVDEPNVHAAQLTLLVEELLSACKLSFSNLAAVAVSKGPGSYTGLRIGVSAAKGLCYAADLPLIGISTLAGMARGFMSANAGIISENSYLCPMIDARRMEVYAAVYDCQLQLKKSIAATIIDGQSFDYLEQGHKMFLFGSGADKFDELFEDNPQVEIMPDFKNSARHLSGMAYEAFSRGIFEDVAYFEPYYLKDFVATAPKQQKNS